MEMKYKYHKQYRLKGYDYSRNGYYFVTICTKDKIPYFGKCEEGRMQLSEIGKVAKMCWMEIPNHFSHVLLDVFVVMPDHVHGILIFHKKPVGIQNFVFLPDDNFGLHPRHNNRFGPQSKNLGSIIRGFKVGVKKWTIMNKKKFIWQPRFHDRIIRDEDELYRIREYILLNPEQWDSQNYQKKEINRLNNDIL